jgi:PepSY-associated TM region
MRPLTLIHRWLGIIACLLFSMWFASGIVMHFVPFPVLTEADRIEGLAPLDMTRVLHGPEGAARASGRADVMRVRLLQRSDGPVYLLSAASGLAAFHADDLADAAVRSEALAVAIAADHARWRGIDAARAAFADLADFDQWTVAGDFDRHHQFYRVALNDEPGTELYVSSVTGEVVQSTTRFERGWNYVGSVAHWIYPVVLRSRPAAWEATVWALSFVAMIAALAGSLLGLFKVKVARYRLLSPYGNWHWWHHMLGLLCATFVLTWIFSGWLSMDNGLLFSTGSLSEREKSAVASAPVWETLPAQEKWPVSTQAREIEWFAFGQNFYRRERTGVAAQSLFPVSGSDEIQPPTEFLRPREVGAFVERLARGCKAPFVVDADDDYAIASRMPNTPVYRSVCGEVWYHIDGADGTMLERSDPSRRAYRWLYSALHTMDFPALTSRPRLRSALIVTLCSLGFVFSLTGVVIGWRRLRLCASGRNGDVNHS